MENHTINKSRVDFSSSSSSVAFLKNSSYSRVDAAGNTVSNSLVDVTNLTNGRHKLTISANGTFDYDGSLVVPYSHSFDPIYFKVIQDQAEPSPAPSPTEPFSLLAFVAATAVLSLVILLIGIAYRRHRKTA